MEETILTSLLVGFSGVASVLGIFYCIKKEKNYRKAKQVLDQANTQDVMSVEEAIQYIKEGKKQKDQGFVFGKVQSLDNNKIVYKEQRPRTFSYFPFKLTEDIRRRLVSSHSFQLVDNKSSMLVTPYSQTLSFGLPGEIKHGDLLATITSFILIFASKVIPIPASVELINITYSVEEGNYITVFGTLSYNTSKGTVEMPKVKFLSTGTKTDLLSFMANDTNEKWWEALGGKLLTGVLIGVFACSGYILFKNLQKKWKAQMEYDKSHANDPSVVNVKEVLCSECKTNFSAVIFMPCGHVLLCKECDEKKNLSVCPTCKSAIISRSNLIIS